METYPLQSLTIEQAMALQFSLVDAITKEFPGNEILTRGDLGVVMGYNQPVYTRRIEKVLASFFECEDALLVRGAGTNAIRLALHAHLKSGQTILVHDAPIYPTTETSFDMLHLNIEKVNFNDTAAVINRLNQGNIDGVLIQVTRQKLDDSYNLGELISAIRDVHKTIPIITDDNYSALKTEKIGAQYGADAACFSTFKLLGPEGIGCIVGTKKTVEYLRKINYSGGGQVQGHEAIDVLRGMIYAPVSLAISAKVSEEVNEQLNRGVVRCVEQSFIVNAQSKVVVLKLQEPIAKQVIEKACQLGALPNPVGAESKYEFSPLFYRVSGTFRKADPDAEHYMIRINPNRSGAKTILSILEMAIESVLNERNS